MLEKFEGEKRKQYLVLGAAFAIGVGVILFLSEQTGKKKKEKPAPVPQIKVVEEKKVEEETFKSVYGRKLLEQEEEIEKLKRELEKLRKENESLREKKASGFRSYAVSPPPPPPPPGSGGGTSGSPPPSSPPPPPPPTASSQPPKGPPQTQVLTDLIVLDIAESKEEKKEAVVRKVGRKKSGKFVGDVIPAGSFVPGILLNGLNAPAGGKALSNPLPVLIRLTDLSILPNRFRVDIRDCFVVGAGYGDLSSERAYIRLETLSCVKESGEVVERKVEGYVSGEDGLVGLAGRVITKQGQILARTLVAGFLEGVSRAFQYSGTNVIINPQGAIQTVDPRQALRIGLFSGAAEATRKLADFYMKLANQMFPVVEVNAGRKVDVVFLKSVDLGGTGG
ncbi:MAG TPA: hypothetical protein ENJ61_00280 [Aquifex aeolicus]|uniref:Conjugal transfer protein TraB n=1 Tax=Aquifex aeolicus TaxID=63363 RepID=A0A7C5QH21_AQUAO|nr:hypothetical protein [Aquifex aeolicus]